uniref:Uncharacterized protein n=1 Tax=Rhizobium phage LG08 TaxID=3129229 RepID=A0AAU8HXY1_9CAUD
MKMENAFSREEKLAPAELINEFVPDVYIIDGSNISTASDLHLRGSLNLRVNGVRLNDLSSHVKVGKEKIDAVLHNVSFISYGDRGSIAYGTIEADSKDRFRDGDFIHTSKIASKIKNILKTRNTVYFIASYAEGFQDWEL